MSALPSLASDTVRARRLPGLRLFVGALVVLAAALVAVRFAMPRGSSQIGSAASAATTTARDFGVKISSYDWQRINDDTQKVVDLSVAPFRDQYAGSARGNAEGVKKSQLVAVGTVQQAGVISASDSTATVLLNVDQTLTGLNPDAGKPVKQADGTTGKQPDRVTRYVSSRMVLTVVKQNGRWFVSDVKQF